MDRVEYLLSCFELHVLRGYPVDKAWTMALEDYAQVYVFGGDNKLAEAARVALNRLGGGTVDSRAQR